MEKVVFGRLLILGTILLVSDFARSAGLAKWSDERHGMLDTYPRSSTRSKSEARQTGQPALKNTTIAIDLLQSGLACFP